jgi:hypothetical protein
LTALLFTLRHANQISPILTARIKPLDPDKTQVLLSLGLQVAKEKLLK